MIEWDVIDVKQESPLTLSVRFADGLNGKVRFEPSRFRGVFDKLKDPAAFAEVYVKDGYVTWLGELDLAPDTMYDAIKACGEWVLR